jgi:hypothetical protein
MVLVDLRMHGTGIAGRVLRVAPGLQQYGREGTKNASYLLRDLTATTTISTRMTRLTTVHVSMPEPGHQPM